MTPSLGKFSMSFFNNLDQPKQNITSGEIDLIHLRELLEFTSFSKRNGILFFLHKGTKFKKSEFNLLSSDVITPTMFSPKSIIFFSAKKEYLTVPMKRIFINLFFKIINYSRY